MADSTRYTENRKWEFHEPDEQGNDTRIQWTEGQILSFYWDWWSQMMRERGEKGINPGRCIKDWTIVFWASKVIVEKPDSHNFKNQT